MLFFFKKKKKEGEGAEQLEATQLLKGQRAGRGHRGAGLTAWVAVLGPKMGQRGGEGAQRSGTAPTSSHCRNGVFRAHTAFRVPAVSPGPGPYVLRQRRGLYWPPEPAPCSQSPPHQPTVSLTLKSAQRRPHTLLGAKCWLQGLVRILSDKWGEAFILGEASSQQAPLVRLWLWGLLGEVSSHSFLCGWGLDWLKNLRMCSNKQSYYHLIWSSKIKTKTKKTTA